MKVKIFYQDNSEPTKTK